MPVVTVAEDVAGRMRHGAALHTLREAAAWPHTGPALVVCTSHDATHPEAVAVVDAGSDEDAGRRRLTYQAVFPEAGEATDSHEPAIRFPWPIGWIPTIHRRGFRPVGPVSLAVGVFDGVHRGHQELLRRAVDDAARLDHGIPAVLTFDPNPATTHTPR